MMNLNELDRLKHLHDNICSQSTGSPAQIAVRHGISERSVYRLVEKLKEMNAPVYFDRNRNSYCYREFFELEVNISVRILYNDEVVKIYGGSLCKKIFPCRILAVAGLKFE